LGKIQDNPESWSQFADADDAATCEKDSPINSETVLHHCGSEGILPGIPNKTANNSLSSLTCPLDISTSLPVSQGVGLRQAQSSWVESSRWQFSKPREETLLALGTSFVEAGTRQGLGGAFLTLLSRIAAMLELLAAATRTRIVAGHLVAGHWAFLRNRFFFPGLCRTKLAVQPFQGITQQATWVVVGYWRTQAFVQ
jgi:hypothetical protein